MLLLHWLLLLHTLSPTRLRTTSLPLPPRPTPAPLSVTFPSLSLNLTSTVVFRFPLTPFAAGDDDASPPVVAGAGGAPLALRCEIGRLMLRHF